MTAPLYVYTVSVCQDVWLLLPALGYVVNPVIDVCVMSI